ncbi:hypothetical protein ON010_g1578 [Phytophthora cinnamomi]|nr:hypothetical protein ON010_g1578 [Phytophthora cinnamomi]
MSNCGGAVDRYSDEDGSEPESQSPRSGRDKHRAFVAALAREMFDGTWKRWQQAEDGLVYAGGDITVTSRQSRVDGDNTSSASVSIQQRCVAKESMLVLKGRSRTMRECTVCRLEGRSPTQKTDFCESHNVALCKRTYPINTTKPHLCQDATWTCWQKYHQYYHLKRVYTLAGNLMRSSDIYKAQALFLKKRTKNSQD